MSLNAEAIHLHWIASNQRNIYLPNVVRAWADALDNFHYVEHIAGIDLRAVAGKREEKLLNQLGRIVDSDAEPIRSDVYLAGSASALNIAEQFFLGLGLPKPRVSVNLL